MALSDLALIPFLYPDEWHQTQLLVLFEGPPGFSSLVTVVG